MARAESRGAHTRTDFPETLDEFRCRLVIAVSGVSLHPPIGAVREAVTRALAEDLTPMGDLTASLVDPGARVNAAIVARQDGVIAGTLCVEETCRQVDPDITRHVGRFGEGWTVGRSRRRRRPHPRLPCVGAHRRAHVPQLPRPPLAASPR